MIVSASENIHHSMPASATGSAAAPAAAGSWQSLGRYGGALRALGIGGVVETAPSRAPRPAEGGAGTAHDPNRLAQFFDGALKAARADNPAMAEADARHVARHETIMANRGDFPPEALRLRTELAGGGAIVTDIPAARKPATPAPPPVAMSTPVALAGDGGARATAAAVAAAYAEWS